MGRYGEIWGRYGEIVRRAAVGAAVSRRVDPAEVGASLLEEEGAQRLHVVSIPAWQQSSPRWYERERGRGSGGGEGEGGCSGDGRARCTH